MLSPDQESSAYPKADKLYLATDQVLKKVTGLKNPEGCAAVIQMPQEANLSTCKALAVFDHIHDPGNLGTLLRTALAFGFDGAYLIGGVDPFNEKTIRASMGAIFHLPFKRGSTSEFVSFIKEHSIMGICGDLDGLPIEDVKPKKPYAIILGSEAHGIDTLIKQNCTAVTIEISNQTESLNVAVAGGILFYALDPRRLR